MILRRRRAVLFRSRLSVADQCADAVASLRAHPVRSMAMSLGVLLGVGTVVTTISLADSARLEVQATFDALRATRVDVQIAEPVEADDDDADAVAPVGASSGSSLRSFPDGATERVAELDGVRDVGLYADWRNGLTRITSSHVAAPSLRHEPRVMGVGTGAMEAAEATTAGGAINRWHVAQEARVALVGEAVADQLGFVVGEAERYVYVDGVPFLVIGVVEDGGRLPQLEGSVVVPLTTLVAHWPVEEEHMVVHVESGAAPGLAAAIPYAIAPTEPDRYSALEPTDPRAVRQVVESDLQALGLWLALVATLAGVIGIASSTYGAIYERMNEFGLRRAIGARAGHLRRHVLTECAALGLLAGIVGSLVGLVVIVAVSSVRGWTPIVDPRLPLLAPLLGLASGLAAGVIPAWKAGRIEPADALRR